MEPKKNCNLCSRLFDFRNNNHISPNIKGTSVVANSISDYMFVNINVLCNNCTRIFYSTYFVL